MRSHAAPVFALAALLATASLHAQEPGRGALCKAFEGQGGTLTLVNLVPRRPAGGAIDLADVDVDADGVPDPVHLACTPANERAPGHCKLTLNLAGGRVLAYEREHIALVQAGQRVYVASAQGVCRAHRLARSAELAAVVQGRLVTRCGPVARPPDASADATC